MPGISRVLKLLGEILVASLKGYKKTVVGLILNLTKSFLLVIPLVPLLMLSVRTHESVVNSSFDTELLISSDVKEGLLKF